MTDDEIDALAQGFCACALPKERWTHHAHFATALWLIRTRPDVQPERDMPDMIRRYNESVGGVNSDSSGYHETITLASLHMARRLLAGLPDDVTPATAYSALMCSPLKNKEWPFSYWSRDLLMASPARLTWVEPDIRPLPA
ncbi:MULTISPECIES: hypothetical protein [Sphingobium]|uniref:Uncharacterized protein n=2 Tax=Sphingobium cupriresistens TaxID=1132417 RepID=A0A0J7XZH9_9SPHN|nr:MULTISPECIES: hypothetical protein [Sphingobium]KMS56937.1 hypothetical protein V473_01395 [Sphingobium cupriresistens LL01]RYM14180.1 hypothetical protein EWH12_03145 [Sphingobium cupriresistens]